MAYTQQQIMDVMVAGNQAGLSNADIIAKLGTYGVTPMDAVQAYQNSRPDLFGSTEQIQSIAASAPLADIPSMLQSTPGFQARVGLQDYARQFEAPPPDAARTYYTPGQDGSFTPLSEKQIYDGMVASNQAGFSNADIIAGASKYGLNEGALMNAYQSQRPELFNGSAPAASPSPQTPSTGTGLAQLANTLPPSWMQGGTTDPSRQMNGGLNDAGNPFGSLPGGNTQTGGANPYLNPQSSGGQGGFGYQSNPWMSSVADDIGRRTQQGLGQAFNQIRSNSVGNGTLGGSRQGVAEGIATRGAMDSLQGNLAGLYGSDWTGAQNRGLTERGQDMGFYSNQRGQDLQQLGLGAQITDMGYRGGWMPLNNASGILNTTAGNNVTSSTGGQQGGGWQGLLGGALGGAALGGQLGWWK